MIDLMTPGEVTDRSEIEQPGTDAAASRCVHNEPGVDEPLPDDEAAPVWAPRGPDMSQRALTLKEAAALLHVSYWTVHAHRENLGFFKVGGAWRVWPDKLREATASSTPPTAPKVQENKPCPSISAKAPKLGISMSARQAANELDKLLAQPTKRRRKNTTTG